MASEDPAEITYHLELSPAQLKVTHTALRSLLDDFGHDQADITRIIHDVLAKLPDEHSIRAIDLGREAAPDAGEGPGDAPEPPSAA